MDTSNHAVVGRGKTVAYVRVSTAALEKDPTLSAQIVRIRCYVRDRGLALSGEFVEHGATGTDGDRSELGKSFQEIRRLSSEVGTIIVTDRSRFVGDATKARLHEDALREHGIRLVAIQEAVSDAPSA